MNNYFHSIIDIIPEIVGFVLGLSVLVYFIYDRNIRGMLYASSIFIGSGFIAQILWSNLQSIKNFIVENKDILNFPILSTVIGIFGANQILRYLTARKEKREISILFENAINSQFRFLELIEKYLFLKYENINKSKGDIDMYLEKLKDNKYFITAFNKIGIYDYFTIDLISKYAVKLEETLTYIEKYYQYFNNVNKEIKSLSIQGDKYNEPIFQYERSFVPTYISIITTSVYGVLCIYFLEINYKSKSINEAHNKFITSFNEKIKHLKDNFDFTMFFKISKKESSGLIDDLRDIREKYRKITNNTYITNPVDEDPIYISQILFSDVLLQRASPVVKTIYTNKEAIVAFGNSEVEAINNSKSILKHYLEKYCCDFDEHKFNNIIKSSDIKPYLISPWG
ncbi:hypothetical protein [Limnoraphis robusta]|uniref:hypothetical protein n=1 Tax=Limnoraphis robusta TaxID=1118279 RepID=UPI002B20594E|nr:hypothetical protein [Limnoraphis robusta]MEA5500864.1 hypothetical protein [Limnoraphis robusta BA-68 BA1]